MLRALRILNFALVAELYVEFAPGLTVITGESGAGKSILLDAFSLVLGARLRRGQIRPGADSCDVAAEFDLDEQAPVRRALAQLDLLEADDSRTCLVRRSAGEGRSRAFVNGVPTTLGTLRSVTEPLVDIHGQHEHRQLLSKDVQRRLLDDFGVDGALVREVADAYRERERRAKQLADVRAAGQRSRERESLLRYQVDELASLGDSVHRVDELDAEHKRLARARQLMEAVSGVATDLDDRLIDGVGQAVSALEDAADAALATALELVVAAQTHLEEARAELRRYLQSFPEDDSRLAELDSQLTAIHDMARKHRVSARELGRTLRALSDELSAIVEGETRTEALTAALADADRRYREAGKALSSARQAAAGPFADQVNAALAELGLATAKLHVERTPAESAAGLEQVEFKVRANPRYPASGLADIASGGELARIGLAIDVVAAARSKLPCLVLDEADVGVGGTSADVVGRMLRRLSATTQVIVVTHAPQIAALGDQHLKVSKTSEQDTVIEVLEGAGRVEELARMLGGRTISDDSRAYARALLAGA